MLVLSYFMDSIIVMGMEKPQERKFIALVSIFVALGFATIQFIGILSDVIHPLNMIPLFGMQSVLIILFAYGYFKTS